MPICLDKSLSLRKCGMALRTEQSLQVRKKSLDGKNIFSLQAAASIDSGVPDNKAADLICASVFSSCSKCKHNSRNFRYRPDEPNPSSSSPIASDTGPHLCNPTVNVDIGIPAEGVDKKPVNIFVSSQYPNVNPSRKAICLQGPAITRSEKDISAISNELERVKCAIPPTCPLIKEGIRILQVEFDQGPVSPSNSPTTA